MNNLAGCFKSLRSFGDAIGMSDDELKTLDPSQIAGRYSPYPEKKKNGGVRWIEPPDVRLKAIQRRINAIMLRPRTALSTISYGSVKGRTPGQAAMHHVNASFLGCLDIIDFFPSVSNKHVYQVFLGIGCSPNVARAATILTTRNGHLPQGAPTSSSLANLALFDFDQNIMNRALALNVTITRYVDDITLSGSKQDVLRLVDWCFSELNRNGFKISRREKKLELRSRGFKQRVLGLNVAGHLSIPSEYVSKLRTTIRLVRRHGVRQEEKVKIAGKINYIRKLNPKKADELVKYLDRANLVPNTTRGVLASID